MHPISVFDWMVLGKVSGPRFEIAIWGLLCSTEFCSHSTSYLPGSA